MTTKTSIVLRANDGAEFTRVVYDKDYDEVSILIYDFQESGFDVVTIHEDEVMEDCEDEHDEDYYHSHSIHTIG